MILKHVFVKYSESDNMQERFSALFLLLTAWWNRISSNMRDEKKLIRGAAKTFRK